MHFLSSNIFLKSLICKKLRHKHLKLIRLWENFRIIKKVKAKRKKLNLKMFLKLQLKIRLAQKNKQRVWSKLWLKSKEKLSNRWRFLNLRSRSKDPIWLKRGTSLLRTHSSFSNVSKCVILCPYLVIGLKNVVIFSINEESTKFLSNFPTLSSRRESRSCGRRVSQQTNLKLSNKKWESDFSQRWVRLISITKFYMTRSLNTRRRPNKLATETFTTKAKNMKSKWRSTSLAECHPI